MENTISTTNTTNTDEPQFAIQNPFAALPPILNAVKLAEVMGISRAAAYNLMHRADFPTLRVGSRKLVATNKLLEWIDKNSNNGEDYYG